MAIPIQDLIDAGVDVAGGLTDVFLNRFSEAHQRYNPAMYTGSIVVKEFTDWMRITYVVQNPMEFSFSSIPLRFFQRVWNKHLVEKGADPKITQNQIKAPPNISLKSKKVKFTIDVFDGSDTSKVKLSVPFEWDLLGRAAVYLKDEGPDKRAVRLEPIKVAFSQPNSSVKKDIRAGIARAVNRVNSDATPAPWNVNDPVWCTNVEQLILLLLNNIVSTQISNFIREFQLPRAVELVDGVSLQPDFLLIKDGFLIVGGQVVPQANVNISQSQKIMHEVVRDFQARTDLEVAPFPEEQAAKATDDEVATSEAVEWLRKKADARMNELSELRERSLAGLASAAEQFVENVFIATNSELFDSVAKSELQFSDMWRGEKRLDRIVKAEAGWSASVTNGHSRIVNAGIAVEADAQAKGFARVCHFDLDPKNFGEWRCHGPCVVLKFDPNFGLEAFPIFESDGVYFKANLTTRGVQINFCDWPSWANRILGWITSVLTRPILDVLRVVVSFFKIKVMGYPLHFPGTGIEWQPQINNKPRNESGYLIFGGDPMFK